MTEFEREQVLEERAEELQKTKDRLMVSQMAARSAAAFTGKPIQDEEYETLPTRGSTRKVTTTGKSAVKSNKLDELKRKRESKKRRAEKVRIVHILPN